MCLRLKDIAVVIERIFRRIKKTSPTPNGMRLKPTRMRASGRGVRPVRRAPLGCLQL